MKEELRAFWHYTIGKFFYQTPPILTLFVTARCNARCKHCFYWQNLEKGKKELSLEEIKILSRDLGRLELLLVSGGEPFLRDDLDKIVEVFWRHNCLKTVSLITNGLLPAKTEKKVEKILKISPYLLVIVPLSLDATKELHDKIRGVKGAFEKVQETYRRLLKLKKKYPNLRIRFNATVFSLNYQNLFRLVDQMPEFFPESPESWAFSLNLMRGDPRDPHLKLPQKGELKKLFRYKTKKFKENRSWTYKLFERIIFAAQIKTLREKRQVVPCEAGKLMAVVYEDGAVGHCELLPPLGNIKDQSFSEIWQGDKASQMRKKIVKGKCFCTHECALLPSLLAHPLSWLELIGK